MKHIKSFQLFETLKTYDMAVAKKVLAREFTSLGIKDFRIFTDEDVYLDPDNKWSKEEYDEKIKHGMTRNEILDKLIMVTFDGGKKGDCKNVIKNIDKILYAFDKVGWFAARAEYEYGKWTPPVTDKGSGVGEKRSGDIFDMKELKNMPEDTHYIHIVLDPIYDDEVKSTRIFYHVTKKEIADKIFKEGLLPKSHSKIVYYPQRIYMSKTLHGAESILPQLRYVDHGNYVILKVTVPENISIYKDTRYKDEGVYILDPVSPEHILIAEPTQIKINWTDKTKRHKQAA